ncbi:MAG: phospholipase D-like domain-containing protein [Actinobacteria bacterium]|nr:phospholipase D-like domain-containing protein [Cyanobacteriota bacterium]MCL5772259.1 phospholipase D-like domain-containing protein [Actinomycetota bacterium]
MNSDLTFITNEDSHTLKERFEVLIKDTRFFDCLVGYFYISGFYSLYKSLENTEKIRILIGINTSRQVYELINNNYDNQNYLQQSFTISHHEAKQIISDYIQKETEDCTDSREVEEGILKFKEWSESKKLEIKAYPTHDIHAKLYIMTFNEEDKDIGRVITGSSNFSKAGLVENLEFNVELKNSADYKFALDKFNQLWKDAVDVSDTYLNTISEKTWLNQTITPYQLYLKFLYEYFKDDLNKDDDINTKYYPKNFLKLDYQSQAVINAKKILEDYGGVFISDVVGLGKTYISAMLAGQLDGRTLVIAPPVLLDENNSGSWPAVFSDFRIAADFESVGKLDHILKRNVEKYTNIIIDEAHRFRNENNITYEKLTEICRGKRVILVTATPYNNSPGDILNQIKLFQSTRKSSIPNVSNLESFFNRLKSKLDKIDKKQNYIEYININKENSREIREKVLKYLMVRRTRTEIEKYFADDLRKQNLKFPEVKEPVPLFYELNDIEDKIFNKTIQLIAKNFSYARYTPMLYYNGKITEFEKQQQRNLGKFMKILLVKRLESSFFAFKKSIERFINSYEIFIKEYNKGNVYLSKNYSQKLIAALDSDDDELINKLIEEDKVNKYPSSDFSDEFKDNLEKDLNTLKEIEILWNKIERDPKLLKFLKEISTNKILKNNKIIIFTESRETAKYLADNIENIFPSRALCYSSGSNSEIRQKVIENFDANYSNQKNDYNILISTEVLSEGVNLHQSNIVINYDIPWNPTRMMQRVGRINRVDTKFDTIYTFNFFPTKQSNDQIQLKETAQAKIDAFLTLLGGDASLLTEGEPVTSHELFDRLLSKKTITGEDESEESELKYLSVIKDIRDKQPELFEKIKKLPKKAKTAKIFNENKDCLLSYFKKGQLDKFYISSIDNEAAELDFLNAAKIMESSTDDKRQKIPSEMYFELLGKNKKAFEFSTSEEIPEVTTRRGKNSAGEVIKIIKITLKNSGVLTDDQEAYLYKIKTKIEEGNLPKPTITKTLKALIDLKDEIKNPLKVTAVIQKNISDRLLQDHYSSYKNLASGKKEVILSLYFTGD